MAKSSGNPKGGNRGTGKSGSQKGGKGAGGWPNKTGNRNPSGGGRNNAPSKGKGK